MQFETLDGELSDLKPSCQGITNRQIGVVGLSFPAVISLFGTGRSLVRFRLEGCSSFLHFSFFFCGILLRESLDPVFEHVCA